MGGGITRGAGEPPGDPLPEVGGTRAQRAGFVAGPLFFLFLMLWPGLPFDGDQRRVAAITALTATWWITVALPIGVTSLVPAALLPLLGVMPAIEVAPLYMKDLVFLFLGAFIVALGLERWNVHRRIALFIIARVGTRPRRLVLGFMVASSFLSMWINNTATTLLMLPIGLAVIESLEGETERSRARLTLALLLGMAYSASVGGMATPVGTAPNQEFLQQFRDRYPDAPELSFGRWMLAWGPLVLLYLPLGWLVLTRVAFRISNEGTRGGDAIRAERERMGPMTRPQVRMSIVFVATALLWVTRVDLPLGTFTIPGWVGLILPADVEVPAKFVTDATVATTMAILCFVVPSGATDERGRSLKLMDWHTANRLPWEVLLLLGGGFCIAAGFQQSGLDRVLGGMLAPAIAGTPDWVVVALVVVFMATLTEVTSNTATTAVLLPVMATAAVAAGVSPLMTMAPATIAASAAFMLPVATPPNAVVFSSRKVPIPTMARTGIWLNALLAILITVVFQLWVRRVFEIGSELPGWAK
jgi:sodium-dependent dicarboxylate transporter 2/3/5